MLTDLTKNYLLKGAFLFQDSNVPVLNCVSLQSWNGSKKTGNVLFQFLR